ncbi:heterokaryon incompatibility protein-domain-containing protein, partial [Xylaria digitata]
MNPAVYQPLDRGKREFRLARIKPAPHSEHDDDPIEVTLEHASLNSPPAFTALSYTWGDEEDEDTILVNAIPTTARRNLHNALLQLRKRVLDGWIWIDAICIDQKDDTERSWQVNEMRSIFSLADLVYCWLGPAADGSDAAFHMLKRVAQEVEDSGLTTDGINLLRGGLGSAAVMRFSTPEDEEALLSLCNRLMDYEELLPKGRSHSQGALVLENLLHRPFFSRVWIIQEFSLAKQCQFLCGQNSLDAYVFDIATKAITLAASYNQDLSLRIPSWADNFFFPFNWTYMNSKPLRVRQAITFGERPDLCDIISVYSRCPGRPLHAASDPRDIIFGVLGCAADAESLGLQADYSKPVNQVFAETTKALIRQRRRYQLGYCTFLKYMPGLPSWVPDWKRLGEFGVGFYPINQTTSFAADHGLLDPPNDADRGVWEILRTCGWYVDVVTAVMKPAKWEVSDPYSPPFLSPDNQTRWLSEIVEFFHSDALGKPDEVTVWRTVVLDQQRRGERTTSIWQDLAPRVFRGAPLDVEELTPDQLEFIKRFHPNGFDKFCLSMMEEYCRFRTLFKTSTGKIGLGPEVMLAGDIVTVLHGNRSPIILRPESDQFHSYVGDAYVHTIMDGEFAATGPELKLFEL